jgi:hypothetical protein
MESHPRRDRGEVVGFLASPERCKQLADGLNGREVRGEAQGPPGEDRGQQMMSTYLSESADALDCLPMVEAGELGHVEVVGRTSRHANRGSAGSFEWVRLIQERHFRIRAGPREAGEGGGVT